jgi:diguanylate cyclase (GGDEF)-like protein
MSSPARRFNDRRLGAMGGQLVAALRAADGPGAEAVVTEALNAGIAPTAIQVELIAKGMARIGDLWEQGDVTIADEHVATGLCDRALLALQGPLQVAPPRSRERIVLAAVEGQTHVLGLQMVADVLAGAGYEVLNLGADVPSASLQAFVAEHMPAIVGLSSTQVGDAPRLAGAIVAVQDALRSTRIMLGGNGVPLEWRNAPYPWVSNTLAVLDAVERLLEGPPLQPPATIVELNADLIASPPRVRAAANGLTDERLAAELAESGDVARRYARLAAEYRYLAYRDPLTALPNRRAFEDRMIALSVPGQHNALLVVDIDGFKQINDGEGHDAGDALLREVAQTIRGAVREGDTVARVGGDEFMVLLPACTHALAARVAEQIRAAVLASDNGRVTVSVGGAQFGSDRRRALLQADGALYAAKAAGRNRTEVAAAP